MEGGGGGVGMMKDDESMKCILNLHMNGCSGMNILIVK